MKDLLDHDDLPALRRVVHQLRGTGGGYGFDAITDLAAIAEDAINAADNRDSIIVQINSLIEVIRCVEGFDEQRRIRALHLYKLLRRKQKIGTEPHAYSRRHACDVLSEVFREDGYSTWISPSGVFTK